LEKIKKDFFSWLPKSSSSSSSYGAPEPSYNSPEPSYNAPEPSYNAPEPSYNAPEPLYNAPEPSYNAPEPAYNAPEPSYDAPVYTKPEASYEEPLYYSAPKVSVPRQPLLSKVMSDLTRVNHWMAKTALGGQSLGFTMPALPFKSMLRRRKDPSVMKYIEAPNLGSDRVSH
jgi:hypothetical protein